MKWNLRKCVLVSGALHLVIFWGAASLSSWGGSKTIYRPQYQVRLVGMEEIGGSADEGKQTREAAKPAPPPEKPAPKKPEVAVPEEKPKPPEEKPKAPEVKQAKVAPSPEKDKPKPEEPAKAAPAKEKTAEPSEASRSKDADSEKALSDVLARIEKKVARAGKEGSGGRPGGGSSGWDDRQAELLYSSYYDEVESRVRQNWIPPQNFDPNRESLMTVVSLALLPDGRIQSSFIEQSSGSPYFDQSVMRAILKSDPFPPPPVGLKMESFELGLRFHSSPFAEW
ncbi:MAG: cell envelope integrity protein TolA [bacterium]